MDIDHDNDDDLDDRDDMAFSSENSSDIDRASHYILEDSFYVNRNKQFDGVPKS